MCLTVTQPPPGFFFWNWNKAADDVLDLLNALKLRCIPDFFIVLPTKGSVTAIACQLR